jgi:hypothetical protein
MVLSDVIRKRSCPGTIVASGAVLRLLHSRIYLHPMIEAGYRRGSCSTLPQMRCWGAVLMGLVMTFERLKTRCRNIECSNLGDLYIMVMISSVGNDYDAKFASYTMYALPDHLQRSSSIPISKFHIGHQQFDVTKLSEHRSSMGDLCDDVLLFSVGSSGCS